jgi:hypothetical protein
MVDFPDKILCPNLEFSSHRNIISACITYNIKLWERIMERMTPRCYESYDQGPCEIRLESLRETGEPKPQSSTTPSLPNYEPKHLLYSLKLSLYI